uniref:Dol-P-Glc:Glc(2)Man(9)GlcNAc(2)-PP-Dol alpha-1,2-glucosyltransferase n=1 Tax=Parastrongyloides trichosuri TaxID=131310 RepID=A0A0N5A1Z1_PARTI
MFINLSREVIIALIFSQLLFLGHYLLVSKIYQHVPEPYMDEIFHIDQNQRYCRGDFTWNNKLTTPPALYLLSYKLFCNNERFFNSFLYPLTFLALIYARRRKFKKEESLVESYLNVLCIMILPVFFQSTTLFYTDQLSLFSVIMAFNCNPYMATIFFLVAVMTRQTNIVLCLLYLGIIFVKIIDIRKFLTTFLNFLMKSIFQIILILLCVFFVVFYNDGKIVLGDHSAHKPNDPRNCKLFT